MDAACPSSFGAGVDFGFEEFGEEPEAKGISVDRNHVDEFIAMASQVNHHPSMAQDVMTKRVTEIESLNGAVVREGARVGIPTPVNDTITRLVRILEATYDEQF